MGLLDTLEFEESESEPTAIGSDEVEIQVLAVGLNFKDVLTALVKSMTITWGMN